MGTALLSSGYQFRLEPQSRHPEINRFYKSNGDRSKVQVGDKVFTLLFNDEVAAAIRVQTQAKQYFFRSLCVAINFRGRGLAQQLLLKARTETNDCSVYCFALKPLQKLYQRCGFICADIADADSAIRDQFRRVSAKQDIVYMQVLSL